MATMIPLTINIQCWSQKNLMTVSFRLQPRYRQISPGLAAVAPLLGVSVPPAMFKLFALCFAILSLISIIQCTPTASKRAESSPKPETLVTRGLCDFYCPHENVVGKELSGSYTEPRRLYCRYDVEETNDRAFCMYRRVGLSYQSIVSADFYLLPRFLRIPGNCYRVRPLPSATSRQCFIAPVRRMVNWESNGNLGSPKVRAL